MCCTCFWFQEIGVMYVFEVWPCVARVLVPFPGVSEILVLTSKKT